MNRSGLIGLIVFCFCISLQHAAAAVNEGLVASYSFSGNANDASGNGYNGAVFGATLVDDRFGNPGSAYDFDGINDRIDLPSETLNFERTDAFSQSLWIKTTDTDTANNILAKRESSGGERGLSLVLAGGLIRFQLISDKPSGDRLIVRTTTSVNNDQWHHVVATYDGSSSGDGVTLYLDGSPVSKSVDADALTGSILNSVTPTIGSRNSAYHYAGKIDDIRIYDRSLSAEEVTELYVIPEPATLGLFGLSGLAFWVVRRSRIF